MGKGENNIEKKVWEVSATILKAHLIENIEDSCREAGVNINGDIKYYNEDNLEELLNLIDNWYIVNIYISEYKEANIILLDNTTIHIEF